MLANFWCQLLCESEIEQNELQDFIPMSSPARSREEIPRVEVGVYEIIRQQHADVYVHSQGYEIAIELGRMLNVMRHTAPFFKTFHQHRFGY